MRGPKIPHYLRRACWRNRRGLRSLPPPLAVMDPGSCPTGQSRHSEVHGLGVLGHSVSPHLTNEGMGTEAASHLPENTARKWILTREMKTFDANVKSRTSGGKLLTLSANKRDVIFREVPQ